MPLEALLNNEFEFIMQVKQPLSEVMEMPYWKFEEFIERLNKKNEEQNKEAKKQEEDQKKANLGGGFNANKYKAPKYNIPKYK